MSSVLSTRDPREDFVACCPVPSSSLHPGSQDSEAWTSKGMEAIPLIKVLLNQPRLVILSESLGT